MASQKDGKLIGRMLPVIMGFAALALAVCMGVTLSTTKALLTEEMRQKALVLTRTFESQIYNGYGEEDAKGINAAFTRSVQALKGALPYVLEINVYSIKTKQVAATTNPEDLGKGVDPEDLEAAEKDKSVIIFGTEDGKSVIDVTDPIHYMGSIDYVVGIKLDTSENTKALARMILEVAGLGLAILAAMALTSYWFFKSALKPVSQAALSFRDLAQGEADLTKRLAVGRRDEIGRMAEDFNSFIAKLRDIVASLQAAQADVNRMAKEVGRSSASTAAAAAQILAKVDSLKSGAEAQFQGADHSDKAVQEIARNIEAMDKVIEAQATSVSQASAAIEEMVGNIGSVSRSIDGMASRFEEVRALMDEGKTAQVASGTLVSRISDRSTSLQDANTTIASIASRTNLLAMNAAIEAAHAGEAGKGFSVVADEIRKLAENAATQSKAIRRDIAEVQKTIVEMVEASGDLGSAFDKVGDKIGETGNLVSELRGAMAEQGEGSKEILQVLGSLRSITQEVRTGSEAITQETRRLVGEVAGLRAKAEEATLGMAEMSEAAQVLAREARTSTEVVVGAEATIVSMDGAVGRFRI